MKTQDLWIMERARVLRHLHSPILRRKVMELPTHNFSGEVYVHQGDLEALLSPDLFHNLTAVVSTHIIDDDSVALLAVLPITALSASSE